MREGHVETTGIVFDPYGNVQAKQADFLDDGAKFRLMGGAQGGGKSRACRMEGFRSNEIIPRCKGLVLRRSRAEVVKNFIEPLIEETRIKNEDGTTQPYLRWLPSKNVVRFPNGSTIDVGYCEDEGDVERYRGLEYDWICIEELTQWKHEWWQKIMTSLRTTKPGVRPFFFGSTNPGNIGHGWVKRLWITRKYEENENGSDYSIVRATIWDNPALMEADPEYLKLLQSLPEKDKRARLYGDWDVFEGQFFTEYREDLHVVAPHVPNTGIKRRILAIDYGYNKPSSVGWYTKDNQDFVTRYRELYGKGMLYGDLARRIAALTPEDEIPDMIVVDPAALEKKNESTGTSLRDEFGKVAEELGLPWLKKLYPANNNRLDGWGTVRLALQPHIDPNTGITFAALRITSNCTELIRTLPEQVHDKRNVEDLDSSGEDHSEDELRYALMELGISIVMHADVKAINEALKKGADRADLTAKEREFRNRGISRSKSILDKRF